MPAINHRLSSLLTIMGDILFRAAARITRLRSDHMETCGQTTPHPHSLSPLRGEGGPLAQVLENLRGLRRFRAIPIDWKSALRGRGSLAGFRVVRRRRAPCEKCAPRS